MGNFSKKKTICLSATALLMAGAMTVHTAMAYFTTYVTAKGGYPITLGAQTEIKEEFSNWTKRISIENTGGTPCYVRVKAFCGSELTLSYAGPEGMWEKGDGDYWYYMDMVPAEGKTEELLISIHFDTEEPPKDFNVIVAQECTPVLYDESGNPYGDWEHPADPTTGISRSDRGGN